MLRAAKSPGPPVLQRAKSWSLLAGFLLMAHSESSPAFCDRFTSVRGEIWARAAEPTRRNAAAKATVRIRSERRISERMGNSFLWVMVKPKSYVDGVSR
jgi:hypothetical protein